jgi:hypothetical protein
LRRPACAAAAAVRLLVGFVADMERHGDLGFA